MKITKAWLSAWLCLLLMGCAQAQSRQGNGLPYDSWYLGFQAPAKMEVWLETADIEDAQKRIFRGAMSGTVALAYLADPKGWGDHIPIGKGRYIENLGLPQRIYVRWQSLVKPQTYRAIIAIPEDARRLMLTKPPEGGQGPGVDYPRYLSIGLAPGGWIKVWVMGVSTKPVEVLCTRAQIEPKGPGLIHDSYAYSFDVLEPQTREYIQTHPIPYDSWACPNATSSAAP
ncbi:DUF2931 family protein [Dyella japonica]|uniref:DUF2931 family protein n=1 Tax=Dyella japonica TaxID=231455 RepID=UPI0003712468|nr:DUF2931 family protein [Dyella japonica]